MSDWDTMVEKAVALTARMDASLAARAVVAAEAERLLERRRLRCRIARLFGKRQG